MLAWAVRRSSRLGGCTHSCWNNELVVLQRIVRGDARCAEKNAVRMAEGFADDCVLLPPSNKQTEKYDGGKHGATHQGNPSNSANVGLLSSRGMTGRSSSLNLRRILSWLKMWKEAIDSVLAVVVVPAANMTQLSSIKRGIVRSSAGTVASVRASKWCRGRCSYSRLALRKLWRFRGSYRSAPASGRIAEAKY